MQDRFTVCFQDQEAGLQAHAFRWAAGFDFGDLHRRFDIIEGQFGHDAEVSGGAPIAGNIARQRLDCRTADRHFDRNVFARP
jgi:hypothetical protein